MEEEQTGVVIPDELVISKIYFIRGQKVMLDKDLAELYEVETRYLNKAVNRNVKRFPVPDFMFQLSDEEFKNLMFQFGTSSWGGTRKAPYVFSEMGVAMLSGILNSDRAINVNIQIMRIFARIRTALLDNNELRLEIEKIKQKIDSHDNNMEVVFHYLDELSKKVLTPLQEPRKRIGYKPDEL
jgi:hypothetical protein